MNADQRTIDWLNVQDERLEAAGVPAFSPFWRAEVERFYAEGKRRFAGRIGRGGAKSHTAVKVAIGEVIGRDWKVPPGERHVFAFVSQNKTEASQRLGQIKSWLQILGIPCSRREDAIDLDTLPLSFRVFSATIGAVSGFRCCGFVADELAKWSNKDGANPAPEVVASLRAMTVTHPDAVEWFISSPMATLDLHYKMVEEGEDARTQVAIAPTWVANPGVTEEQTHALERDPRVWTREYEAIPVAAIASAFDPDDLAACFRAPLKPYAMRSRVMVMDLSQGRGDAAVAMICGWAGPPVMDTPMPQQRRIARPNADGTMHITIEEFIPDVEIERRKPVFLVEDVATVSGEFARTVTADQLIGRFARLAKKWNVTRAFADGMGDYFVEALLRRHGIRFHRTNFTNSSKTAAVDRLRHYMRERAIILPKNAPLRLELSMFNEKITASGNVVYSGARDDHVDTLLVGMMADSDNLLRGSPYRPPPIVRSFVNLPHR